MVSGCIEECVTFASEGLALKGVLAYPDSGEPTRAVLFLSPHPHLGGTMENNVIRHCAAAAAADGAATMRFNYRGVGGSGMRLEAGESLFDHWERMEKSLRYEEILPDARAALDTLSQAAPGLPVTLVGYSLGSCLAGMLASDDRVDALVAIAPPVKRLGLQPFAACRKPKLIVAGERDFAFDAERFVIEYATLPEPRKYIAFPGGDHFFRKQEMELYAALRPFLVERR